jgi:hypothetical protein
MKITDIINENQTSQDTASEKTSKDKLNVFRRFKNGPEYVSKTDFGDERIELPKNLKVANRQQAGASVANTDHIKAKNDRPKEIERVNRVREVVNKFITTAMENGKNPEPIKEYGDSSFNVSVITNNNVRVGLGGRTGSDPFNLRITIDLVTKENKESLLGLLSEMGYERDPGTETKFKFMPREQKNLETTIEDVYNIVSRIEELGPDFKSSGRSGGGAGSLITGKQAPFQYYMWLAKNIYESVKNNTSWGFSRGGGTDSGEGAYDRYDSLITIGITKGGAEQIESGRNAYREHVVPSDLINRMGIEICKKYPKTSRYKNQVIMEVAKMIHRNLAIVLCSSNPEAGPGRDKSKDGEREKIDYEYGLMTTMPSGWKDGDSILARFSHCGIKVYRNKPNDTSGGKRMAEGL